MTAGPLIILGYIDGCTIGVRNRVVPGGDGSQLGLAVVRSSKAGRGELGQGRPSDLPLSSGAEVDETKDKEEHPSN